MNKFVELESKFWRVRGDCCIFMQLHAVISDDGKNAELRVTWCRQLDKGWKPFGTENTRISQRDYPTWVTYTPRGDNLNAV